MDPELRAALDELREDLRGEIRAGDAETRGYVDESIRASAAETRTYVDESIRASAAETRGYTDSSFASLSRAIEAMRQQFEDSHAATRRHFDVVAESIRSDMRIFAEAFGLSQEGTDRRFGAAEQRLDRLEGRVLTVEARVSTLEKPRRRPRRRR